MVNLSTMVAWRWRVDRRSLMVFPTAVGPIFHSINLEWHINPCGALESFQSVLGDLSGKIAKTSPIRGSLRNYDISNRIVNGMRHYTDNLILFWKLTLRAFRICSLYCWNLFSVDKRSRFIIIYDIRRYRQLANDELLLVDDEPNCAWQPQVCQTCIPTTTLLTAVSCGTRALLDFRRIMVDFACSMRPSIST